VIFLREATLIDHTAGGHLVYPGLGLFLEWCQGGLWRTAWVRLDIEPVKEITPHRS